MQLSEIKEKLASIFNQYPIKEAVVFGSYARGNQHDHSDIDIILDTNLRGLDFIGILGEVKDRLDMEVELIPKRAIIPNTPIDYAIKQEGVVIYEAH